MTFLTELEKLKAAATEGPWFERYCDDNSHMNMTVISSKDYGRTNTGPFNDEADTVAITFHQLPPVSGDTADCNDATTELIILLRNNADAIANLVRAADELDKWLTKTVGSDESAQVEIIGTDIGAEGTRQRLQSLQQALVILKKE